MTREQRIEQIEKFASQCYEDGEKYSAFIAGAIQADENPKNIWHDVSEIPNNRKHILFMTDPYTIKTGYIPDCLEHCKLNDDTWNKFIKDMNIKIWAYIKDLLLKEDEK